MKRQASHRSLKNRVTGLHIAILFSTLVWFVLFKVLGFPVLANIAILIALVALVLTEGFLAYGYKKAAQEMANNSTEVSSSDSSGRTGPVRPEETNLL